MDPAKLESTDMGPARLESTKSPSSLESTEDNETGGEEAGCGALEVWSLEKVSCIHIEG